MIKDQFIGHIQDVHLFGFLGCDIHVSDPLKDHFAEMTSVLKHLDVAFIDEGKFMQKYAKGSLS